MRIHQLTRLGILAILVSTLFSCKDEKEEFTTENISDYAPQVVGKYITYRLDSMVFTNFNKNIEIHRYQVKHVVDALTTDNLGRPSYRIYRFIRDSAGVTPWVSNGSYLITPASDQLEVIEDNLRFIKMHMPLKENFSWKGNRYLPDEPYNSYSFNNDDDMEDWDFYYQSFGQDFSIHNKNYSNVCTVEQIDESLNIPVTLPRSYGYKSRSVDKYSKGIGLVYRDYTLYEYQPDPNNGPNYAYWGFGVTMWMIDHN